MPKGNIHGRLERLEARTPEPERVSGAREELKARLDKIAANRRAVLGPEGAAEVKAVSAALRERLAEIRGEGA